MINFHTELKEMANFDNWNELTSLPDKQKQRQAAKRMGAIHRMELPSFEAAAADTVAYIRRNAKEIDGQDTESLEKLRAIFLSRLSTNDPNVVALRELAQASRRVTDHSALIPHDFDAVTRYLPHRQKCLQIAKERVKEGRILCDLLKKGDWKGILGRYAFSLDLLPIDGLKAFHDGKITMEQFSTLTFFWSIAKQFPGVEIQIQPIFNSDGSVNSDALNFIRQTLETSGTKKGQKPFLDEEEITLFLKKMRLQPESERVFFFIKTEKYADSIDMVALGKKTLEGTLTITEDIHTEVGVNVFNQFEREGVTYRMISSLSMMQQFLNTYAGDQQALKIIPVIGLSSSDDIRDNITTDTRDMALPFPGIDLPKHPDMLLAPYDIDFIYHDFYHCIIASCVGYSYRRAFLSYAKAILITKEQLKDPLCDRYLDELYERIIDMEHDAFRRKLEGAVPLPNPTLGQTFLWALSFQHSNAINRLVVGLVKKQESPTVPSSQTTKEIMEFSWAIAKKGAMQKLIDVLQQMNFCVRYGITREDLNVFVELNKKGKERIKQMFEMFESNPDSMPDELKQETELDGVKLTAFEFAKKGIEISEKMDLFIQLLAKMDEDKQEKDFLSIPAGSVHRRIVLFESMKST